MPHAARAKWLEERRAAGFDDIVLFIELRECSLRVDVVLPVDSRGTRALRAFFPPMCQEAIRDRTAKIEPDLPIVPEPPSLRENLCPNSVALVANPGLA